MKNFEPGTTFRGLPLTAEQDSEIRHYIHVRERAGLPWDTPELHSMLHDMLSPPELADEDSVSLNDSISTEHTAAFEQDSLDGTTPAPGHDRHRQRPF